MDVGVRAGPPVWGMHLSTRTCLDPLLYRKWDVESRLCALDSVFPPDGTVSRGSSVTVFAVSPELPIWWSLGPNAASPGERMNASTSQRPAAGHALPPCRSRPDSMLRRSDHRVLMTRRAISDACCAFTARRASGFVCVFGSCLGLRDAHLGSSCQGLCEDA